MRKNKMWRDTTRVVRGRAAVKKQNKKEVQHILLMRSQEWRRGGGVTLWGGSGGFRTEHILITQSWAVVCGGLSRQGSGVGVSREEEEEEEEEKDWASTCLFL
jgi:hypothetical protein